MFIFHCNDQRFFPTLPHDWGIKIMQEVPKILNTALNFLSTHEREGIE